MTTFIVNSTECCLFDCCCCFFFSNASMCTHIRGVKKRYSLPPAKQMTSTGWIMQSSNGRRWEEFQYVVLLPGLIQQQFLLFPFMENMLTVPSSPPSAFTIFIGNFIHQRHVKSILFKTIQEVPLLFLAPKDNNDFSHCSFIRKVPPTPYHPSCG